ncbi:hypothetical protein P4S95_06870 [Aneurinibacillus aneurinilyticus]|uniref:hypothetical protein n=1 Tax=Aneurinibacillus aneurinilyticus TaxID=1391 RepID=UPI002E1A8902|nr:hypothetical protein [Aneurinibacillus aneurinilyticus]
MPARCSNSAVLPFYFLSRMLIIQYDPEWIVTTSCPKQASVRLPHPSLEDRFLPQPGRTAKHLGRREEGDHCRPLSPGRGMRSGIFHLMDNQQV